MKGINAGNADEESLGEDEKMENIKLIYDVFVQNVLQHTSHTLEWIPRVDSA